MKFAVAIGKEGAVYLISEQTSPSILGQTNS